MRHHQPCPAAAFRSLPNHHSHPPTSLYQTKHLHQQPGASTAAECKSAVCAVGRREATVERGVIKSESCWGMYPIPSPLIRLNQKWSAVSLKPASHQEKSRTSVTPLCGVFSLRPVTHNIISTHTLQLFRPCKTPFAAPPFPLFAPFRDWHATLPTPRDVMLQSVLWF